MRKMIQAPPRSRPRWRDFIAPDVPTATNRLIGVLEGEGIGPEVVGASLRVLEAVNAVWPLDIEIRQGGPIGKTAEAKLGTCLPPAVTEFCEDVFGAGGAILAGPGGGRFVYELRRRFDLFCKLSPIRPCPLVACAGGFREEHVREVDVLFVRENCGGAYQGEGCITNSPNGRRARHQFDYAERDIERLLEVAARLAQHRRHRLQVAVKEGGVPTVTALWAEVAERVARSHRLLLELINVDYAAYRVVCQPASCDVIASPNLIGDILADVAGALVGSRGLTYGVSFAANGAAVYQTNHGSAHPLAGTNRANPVGQMYALAMLLHESFGLTEAAERIESAIESVWRAGWRTEDLAQPGCTVVGTREFAELVERAIRTGEVPTARS